MLTSEEQMELEVLSRHGVSIRQLAKATGRSRNTVRRYLREGDEATVRKPAPKRSEKLDPFRDYIVARLKAAAPDRFPAAVLYREICERGYLGGETRVKQFVRGLVPAPAPNPAMRFETKPGRQMQADWASVGRGGDKLKVFMIGCPISTAPSRRARRRKKTPPSLTSWSKCCAPSAMRGVCGRARC